MEHRGHASDNFCFHRSNVGKDVGVQRVRVAEEIENLKGIAGVDTNEIIVSTYGVVDFGGVVLHQFIDAARDSARCVVDFLEISVRVQFCDQRVLNECR